jgi:hypothetical protein
MFPVHSTGLNQVGPSESKPARKGGFWRFLVRSALKVIAQIPIVGGAVAEAVSSIVVDSGTEETVGGWSAAKKGMFTVIPVEYEPTASEEAILTPWTQTKFNIFYKNLATKLSQSLASTNPSVQLAGINTALAKMCAVSAYFKTNDTHGLSPNAVIFRSDLIEELFAPINQIIADSLNGGFQQTTGITKANPADYAPFAVSGGYTCKQFTATQSTGVQPIITITDYPATSTGATPGAASAGKSNTGLYIAGALAAAILFWPSKKRNK